MVVAKTFKFTEDFLTNECNIGITAHVDFMNKNTQRMYRLAFQRINKSFRITITDLSTTSLEAKVWEACSTEMLLIAEAHLHSLILLMNKKAEDICKNANESLRIVKSIELPTPSLRS